MLDIKIGVNLGDGLDCFVKEMPANGLDIESAWTGAKISERNIEAIKQVGFNAIRLPVSWRNHVSEDFIISRPWLDRVGEVVDWCVKRDMYVIPNIHHDGGEKFLYPSEEHFDNTLKYVTAIWKQLAEYFGDYGEKLIFNSMNEPRLIGHECEWRADTENPDVIKSMQCINRLNQAFVDTVRSAGGKNKTRYLLCPGYDASPEGVLNDLFMLPTDSENDDNRIIVSVHAYVPFRFALDEKGVSEWSENNPDDVKAFTDFMDKLYGKFVSKDIPVVIDEFGARNKNGNTAARISFASRYVSEAKKRGMPCLWWDNNRFKENEEMFGLLDRKTNEWVYADIVRALINSVN